MQARRRKARPAAQEEQANQQGHSRENPDTYSIVTPFIREMGRAQQMRKQ
jgi:hypothetical protein